jgi:hypothetical protein
MNETTRKLYFEYAFGYVNIDEECIYFTATGNWDEVRKLKGNRHDFIKPAHQKATKSQVYLVLLTLMMLGLFYYAWLSRSIMPIFVGVCGFYFGFQAVRHQVKPRFYLPLDEINEVHLAGDKVTITFDEDPILSSQFILEQVSEKGIDILQEVFEHKVKTWTTETNY